MLPPKNWFSIANNAAIAALPAHLNQFVATPETCYQTAWLPVLKGEEQWIMSGFCDDTGPGFNSTLGLPWSLYAPRVLLWIQYPSGDFRWEECAPTAYSLHTAIVDDFGIRLGPIRREHLEKNEWYDAVIHYPPLMRRVVERRWLLTIHSTTDEERETARELKTSIRALYDKPLLPFYQHYGHQFLAWMERAAK